MFSPADFYKYQVSFVELYLAVFAMSLGSVLIVYREERGSVLVSSPAGRKTRARDGSWDISHDQGGNMAARDVQKEVIRPGNGPCPSKGSTIKVHCTGSLNTNPPKKFWRYWFSYECISIARLIYKILFIASVHVMHVKVFFFFFSPCYRYETM